MKVNFGEYKILLTLEHGPQYGLEIQKRLAAQPGATGRPAMPGVYQILKRLANSKLIKSKTGDDAHRPGPPRVYYELTAKGSRSLRDMKKYLTDFQSFADRQPRKPAADDPGQTQVAQAFRRPLRLRDQDDAEEVEPVEPVA